MIRRMVEANYFASRGDAVTAERLTFWLRELRTPALLIEVASRYQPEARAEATARVAVAAALTADDAAVDAALADEERRERADDREYWRPLRAELEQLRRAREP